MKAAAAARQRWARRPSGMSVFGFGAAPGRQLAFVTTVVLAVFAVVVVVCAAIGLNATQRDDGAHVAERHAALRTALEEFRPVFGDADHFAPGQVALIARRAGLSDLRFDADLSTDSRREVQSYQDRQGRITGWFSWAPDRSLIRAMNSLWAIAGLVGLVLALCAVLALRATRRLAAALSRSTATVARLTTQDIVTGLPNRRGVLDRLEAMLAARREDIVAFAVIAIDNRAEIDDTLGHAGSAAMLAQIAQRLKAGLPAGAVLGRFADDEFAVAASGDAQIATEISDKVAYALQAPIEMDQPWHIVTSIGLAQAPQDGTTGDELQRRATLALRAARRSGRGVVKPFVPQIHEEHAERRFFLRELEAAIDTKAFDVHYQPVVAAEGGAMLGVEALLRWTHPTRGVIAPGQFIPLAEESGMMNRLGEIVLRRALEDGARWPGLFIAVNLSPVQMRSRGLVDLVRAALAETRMAPTRLVLEVTEGVLIDNPDEALTRLEALRALGSEIALDDFGSGYSSLNYLQKFPFDRLKIDQTFVASLGTAGTTGAIIQSIVTLGHALGMKVLAEGVETNEQRVLLRLAGCDEMQGYLFAKPAPAEAIDKIVARPRAAPAPAAVRKTAS